MRAALESTITGADYSAWSALHLFRYGHRDGRASILDEEDVIGNVALAELISS